jgi:hypothetical protein
MADTPEPPENLAGIPPESPPHVEPIEPPTRDILELCDLAHALAEQLPDSPDVSAGRQKLLEAKDCFVRAQRPA